MKLTLLSNLDPILKYVTNSKKYVFEISADTRDLYKQLPLFRQTLRMQFSNNKTINKVLAKYKDT